MFTLPSKRMDILQTILAIFKTWASLILPLIPLSILSVFFQSLPLYAKIRDLIQPGHINFYLTVFMSSALYLIPSGAIIYTVYSALHEKNVSLSTALRLSLSRFIKMLFTAILLIVIMSLILMLGNLFMHINKWVGLVVKLGLILSISPYLIPASPLVISDNKSPFDAIASGCRLVKNNWISVLITVVLISLVTVGCNILARHFGLIAMFIISLFTLPLTLIMTVVITENLKLKN